MKPASTAVFNVDKRKITDLYYGSEHYVVEGRCNHCGACCRLNYPDCEFLKDNKCRIHRVNPWFCALYPYDLETVTAMPEECSLTVRRV